MNEREIETFRKEVIEFNTIDTQLKTLKKDIEPIRLTIKLLTEKKKYIQEKICKFMVSKQIDYCNLPKDINAKIALKAYMSEVKKPITHDYIKDSLIQFFNDDLDKKTPFINYTPEQKGIYLYDYIQENRPTKINNNIRQVKSIRLEEINQEYDVLEKI
jgi:hypothetical protein